MEKSAEDKGRNFTAFRSAAEEAATKRDHDTMKGEEQVWDNEGGHMSSTAGRIKRVSDSQLPYLVTLAHHGGQPSEHAFSTMREAEAFIKRNTPVPGAILSTTYDWPASEPQTSASHTESAMNDEDILARLKVIDHRLRQISSEDAASVLAGALASVRIHDEERLQLIAETERILDELDGKNNDRSENWRRYKLAISLPTTSVCRFSK